MIDKEKFYTVWSILILTIAIFFRENVRNLVGEFDFIFLLFVLGAGMLMGERIINYTNDRKNKK